jgi:hypothetical protein
MSESPLRMRPGARFRGKILPAGLLVAASIVAWGLGRFSQGGKAFWGPLVIDAQHLDLGVFWENQEVTRTLPVRNQTERDIEVLEFKASCNCLSVEPKALSVPARGQADIRVKLQVPRGSTREEAVNLWDFKVHVLPVVKEGFLAQGQWEFAGRVRRAAAFRPALLEFAGPLIRGATPQAEKVEVTPLVAATDLRVQCDERSVSVEVTRKGNDFELMIAPAARLPCGRFFSDVSVQVGPETGEVVPARKLRVSGLVCENIQTVPSAVLFGPHPVGGVVRETVTLKSLRAEDFEVEGIDTPSDDIAVEASQNDAAVRRFAVRLRVARPGPNDGTVQFLVRRGDGSRLHVPLAVCCYGLSSEGEALRGGLR